MTEQGLVELYKCYQMYMNTTRRYDQINHNTVVNCVTFYFRRNPLSREKFILILIPSNTKYFQNNYKRTEKDCEKTF